MRRIGIAVVLGIVFMGGGLTARAAVRIESDEPRASTAESTTPLRVTSSLLGKSFHCAGKEDGLLCGIPVAAPDASEFN